MPRLPKKKRKLSVNQNAPPGTARCYLQENFSTLPLASEKLKNGHVLFVYVAVAGSSRTETERHLKAHVPSAEGYSVRTSLNSDIKCLVTKTLLKYKRLKNPNEMKNFAAVCYEQFQFLVRMPGASDSAAIPSTSDDTRFITIPTQHGDDQGTDDMASTPDTFCLAPVSPGSLVTPFTSPSATPLPTSSGPSSTLRSSRELLTPRKARLKKRLNFVSSMRSEQKQRMSRRIESLKANINLQRVTKVKYLNQQLERKTRSLALKDVIISDLRKKLKDAKVMKVTTAMPTTGLKLQKLKVTHDRMKRYNKKKRVACQKISGSVSTVPLIEHQKLETLIGEKDNEIRTLQNEKLELEDEVNEMKMRKSIVETKKDGKTYSVRTRMKVFDALVNQVPTENIPMVMEKFAKRSGETLANVPNRSTVEQMARELGVIADLQSSEIAMKTKDLTLGFDATTQEGVHVNSIHLTTKTDANVIAIDQLPGGTTDDYHQHVSGSVDHLASVYSDFHEEEYEHCRSSIINHISNTMTDRVAVNHCTIQKLEETWSKSLNELNCHLHPLDTIASACRSALKSLETGKGQLFGKDCFAGNLVLQINKFRYKDGKGDPQGFSTFLRDQGLPKGLLPRYRGNRLHILFHTCGKLIEHHSTLLEFFTSGTVSCGGLQSSLRADFQNSTAMLEMQVLGLLGKTLTGPWMKKFYTSAESQIDHVEGISIVRDVIEELERCAKDPMSLLDRNTDFFCQELDISDATLQKLRLHPSELNEALFAEMTVACVSAVIAVLNRQYKRYFELDITEQLKRETKSARSHNIDAEEIMGMFSSAQHRAKNATISFLSARMRARKNQVVPYLDRMYKKKRERVVTWAIGTARKQRACDKRKHEVVQKVLSNRAARKVHKKQERHRKDLEKKLKSVDVADIATAFPDLEEDRVQNLGDILGGRVVGRSICHVWYDEESREETVYSGKIEKLKKRQGQANIYRIGYWAKEETYDDAVDYDMSKYALCADLIDGDLAFC